MNAGLVFLVGIVSIEPDDYIPNGDQHEKWKRYPVVLEEISKAIPLVHNSPESILCYYSHKLNWSVECSKSGEDIEEVVVVASTKRGIS